MAYFTSSISVKGCPQKRGRINYDPNVVTRTALCTGVTIPPPPEIPWWAWLQPGLVKALAKAYSDGVQYIIASWINFGTQINTLYAGNDAAKREAWLIASSIGQACINDRLVNEIQPMYETFYPGRIKIHSLYDSFHSAGPDNNARDFWAADVIWYDKFQFQNNISNSHGDIMGDPVHIGPAGYKHWAEALAPYMIGLGWNIRNGNDGYTAVSSTVPPLDDLINAKANWIGGLNPNGSSYSVTNPLAKNGFCRDFTNSPPPFSSPATYTICVKAAGTIRAFETHGAIREWWLGEGGVASFGFPITDEYATGLLNVDRENQFDCGVITWRPLLPGSITPHACQ